MDAADEQKRGIDRSDGGELTLSFTVGSKDTYPPDGSDERKKLNAAYTKALEQLYT